MEPRVPPGHRQAVPHDLKAFLERRVAHHLDGTDFGSVATYIPELATVDPRQLGVSIRFNSGETLSAGDAQTPFSIQSVSKVFSLALALGSVGDQLWRRVGREPSGNSFDSIVQLEYEGGRPRNPFINAGALVVTDTVLGRGAPRDALANLVRFVRSAAEDDDIHINKAVAASEERTGFKNRALGNYLKSQDNLDNDVDCVLGTYFHQCAIEMTCVQLAAAGQFLSTGRQRSGLVSHLRARRINALMATCGHYDGSGDFAFRVGLPGKSGVGGAIFAIVPGVASMAVWSPGLNAYGNSYLGTALMEEVASFAGWSVFG